MAKRKKGERKIGECTYCGAIGPLTRDHVPPENLFQPPFPANLMTVPACDTCNDGFKLDDEYFRLAITAGIDGDRFPRELEHSVAAIEKLADPKKKGLGASMLQARRQVEISTPAGIYLGQAPGMEVNGPRVLRIVERIVRGLHFHHHKRRIPSDHELIASYIGNRFHPGDLGADHAPISDALLATPGIVLGNDVLRYAFVSSPEDERMAVWLLQFFGNHTFLAVVTPPEQ